MVRITERRSHGKVAPLAGARIEIIPSGVTARVFVVAPLAGARIEIRIMAKKIPENTGRSPRGSED